MKDWFEQMLLDLADEFGWSLEAWAVLSNHYHIIGHSPASGDGGGSSLRAMIRKLHSLATKERNRRDGVSGRVRLWQN